jgi:hypothetical protein
VLAASLWEDMERVVDVLHFELAEDIDILHR